MTVEEKIVHMQEAAMTEARTAGNQILDKHKQVLGSLFEKHAAEIRKLASTKVKAETVRAKQQLNLASAKAQVELKRTLSKRQAFFKDQIFVEVRTLLDDYMASDSYMNLLQTYITNAAAFANGTPLTLYLNANDLDKRAELESRIGLKLTISKEDFWGGIRATIPSRNILIDNSFKGKIESEYENFQFLGGDNIG